jgi:hypothetical protein
MAKIESYVLANAPLSGGDKLIGTDVANANATKNFSINELITFITGTNTYAPYTGATADLDLGSFKLIADAVEISNDFMANGSAGSSGQVLTSQGAGSPVIWTTVSGGSSTLQAVLNNNHDLVNSINTQGTGAGNTQTGVSVNLFGGNAGSGNTGSVVNAFGPDAALGNTGDNVNALGDTAGSGNTGDNCNFFGPNAGENNSGSNVTAFGLNAGKNNSGSACLFIGENAGINSTGNTNCFIGVNAGLSCDAGGCIGIGDGACTNNNNPLSTYYIGIGIDSCQSTTGARTQLIGLGNGTLYQSQCSNSVGVGVGALAFNEGDDVVGLGYQVGQGNLLPNMFIISNTNLPSYANFATASAAITVALGAVAGNTYLYYDLSTNSIGAVRL